MIHPKAIHFDFDRCLNRWSGLSRCLLCENGCPVGAIRVVSGGVERDASLCEGCGLCLSTCPTSAFDADGWDERRFISGVKTVQESGSLPVIACRFLETSKSEHIFRVSVCLAAFSVGAFVEVAYDGDICILVDECKDCPYKVGAFELIRRASAVNEMLESLGREARIRLICSLPRRMTGARWSGVYLDTRSSVSESLADAYARRKEALSSRFFGEGRGVRTASSRIRQDRQRSGASIRCVPNLLPRWKRDFRQFWREKVEQSFGGAQHLSEDDTPKAHEDLVGGETSRPGLPAAKSHPWPTVFVDTAVCVACGTCAQYCPSRALEHHTEDGRWFLMDFTPGICLDCGQCGRSCSTGALSHSYGAWDHPFEKHVIVRRPAHECPLCHGVALGAEGFPCFWCQNVGGERHMVNSARMWRSSD